MRSTIERLVEEAESAGYLDTKFFKDWFELVLIGLSVDDEKKVDFAREERTEFIFTTLLSEKLIERVPGYSGEEYLGQLCYRLTETGWYLAEQLVLEWAGKQTKH